MTKEEQRIAIAEACPNIFRVMKLSGDIAWKKDGYEHDCDPLNDLNAMAEAEKVIPKEKLDDYHYHLAGIVSNWSGEVKASVYKSVFATAAQRAEAFLKCIGKWKD